MSATGRVIDGKPVLFPRMTTATVVDFCELAYQHQRAAILEDKDEGIDIRPALEALRKRRGDLQLLWQFVWTMEGARKIIAESNATVSLESLELWDICKLAGEIVGFDMSPVDNAIKAENAKAEGGDGFVRPQVNQEGGPI